MKDNKLNATKNILFNLVSKEDSNRNIDQEAEVRALGHMMLHDEAAKLGSETLSEKHFLFKVNKFIFSTIKKCNLEGKSIESVPLFLESISIDEWRRIEPGFLEAQDVLNYFKDMKAAASSLSESACFAVFEIVVKHFARREATDLHEKALLKFKTTMTHEEIKTSLLQNVERLEQIIDDTTDEQEEEDFKHLANRILNQKQTARIDTGYSQLDKIIGGMRAGWLVTIGASTSVGKSAFAVNLALNFTSNKHRTAIWSFEMDKAEVMHRIFAIRTGFNSKAIRDNKMCEEHYNAIKKYINNTTDNVLIFNTRISNMDSFFLQCRKLKKDENVSVIIIDYLQLIRLNQNYENNRVKELETITNKLKNIAVELKITIIILSQLSREVNKNEDKKPALFNLRDSGAIEQDSNLVILLHRREDEIASKHRSIEIIVAKNRSGAIGSVILKYDPFLTKFME